MPRKKRFESVTEYKNQFAAEHYDRINLFVPKNHKETIIKHATAQSKTLNGYINKLIDQDMNGGTHE